MDKHYWIPYSLITAVLILSGEFICILIGLAIGIVYLLIPAIKANKAKVMQYQNDIEILNAEISNLKANVNQNEHTD